MLCPAVVVEIIAVLIPEEFQRIAIFHGALGNAIAGVGLAAGGVFIVLQHAVIGHLAVDHIAEVGTRRAEHGGQEARLIERQILLRVFRKAGILQRMGLHQHVQRRNAIGYAVGIAVLLCQIAGHGHIKLRCQQKGSALLHGEVHIYQRLLRVLLRHRHGVGLGVGLAAAGNGDFLVCRDRNILAAAVRGLADLDRYFILLVLSHRRDVDGLNVRADRQRVFERLLGERRLQRALAGRQAGQPAQIFTIGAAQVRAPITGIHDPDDVAVRQIGDTGKAFICEPIVQRAHPAGFCAAVKLGQAVDGADVTTVCTYRRDLIHIQRGFDTGHHGGILCQRNIGIHQCAVPGRAVRFGICGVFHNDPNCSQVLVCPACQDRCGEHSQQQSRCQKQAQQSPFH